MSKNSLLHENRLSENQNTRISLKIADFKKKNDIVVELIMEYDR
jgi:hypothetical protein